VERSAQCRSSTTSSSGACSPRRPSSPSSSSNSRAWATWPWGSVRSGSPRAGSRRASSGQEGPTSSRTAPTPVSPSRTRSASMIGPYGRAPSPTGTQPPASTRVPSVALRTSSSATRRVLPTPASPPTRTTAGSVVAARLLAASRVWSSSTRPTKVGLATRPPISPGLSRASGGRGTAALRGGRPEMGNTPALIYGRCRIRGRTPRRDPALAGDDRCSTRSLEEAGLVQEGEETHEQSACGAEPGAGRAAQDRTAGAGRPRAAVACRSPAAPAPAVVGPRLVATGSVAGHRRRSASPPPPQRQLIN
jgi:hypothetical protein